MMQDAQRRYAFLLWLLLALFCFRVIAQLLQALFDLPWLPAFEQWQGSSLPYGVLLGSQLLIILLFTAIARRFSRGQAVARYRLGVALLIFGTLYFSAMLVRLVLGLTVLSRHHWFASHLPALFHLVLAGYLLLLGHFNWRYRSTGGE